MAMFDLLTDASDDVTRQGNVLNQRYFTVDTVDLDVLRDWLAFNNHMRTYAMHDGHVAGYFNVLPLTMECGRLFEQQAIKEEDLRIEHLLPHEVMQHAQYAYVAAIAVGDTENYRSRQCMAALMAGMADLFLHGYGRGLKKIFANPTTFQGNRLVGRLGLKPVSAFKKGLTANDIYVAEMNDDLRHRLGVLSSRYRRFIGDNPWRPATPEMEI